MRTGFLKIPLYRPKEEHFTSLGASAGQLATGII
jgi:hypothetical protein